MHSNMPINYFKTNIALETIALSDVVSYDDLDFTVLARDMITAASTYLCYGSVVLEVRDGKKRIIFKSASNNHHDHVLTERELVFVALHQNMQEASVYQRTIENFRRHSTDDSHMCLLYRNRQRHEVMTLFREYVSCGLEWRFDHENRFYGSGLLFSHGWDKNVAVHTAAALNRYKSELQRADGVYISLIDD